MSNLPSVLCVISWDTPLSPWISLASLTPPRGAEQPWLCPLGSKGGFPGGPTPGFSHGWGTPLADNSLASPLESLGNL